MSKYLITIHKKKKKEKSKIKTVVREDTTVEKDFRFGADESIIALRLSVTIHTCSKQVLFQIFAGPLKTVSGCLTN